MGSLLYFAIIAIQFSLSTQSVPEHYLRDNVLNIFGRSAFSTSRAIRSSHVNVVKANSVSFDKDAWVFDTKNVEYHGLDNATLDDYGCDFKSNIAKITFHSDMLIKYTYKTSGSLFLKPIYGEGYGEVTVKNVQCGITMPFNVIEVKGKKYMDLKKFDYWFKVRDGANFRFDNLYNGNMELSDSMHSLINEKWEYITSNFGKVFMDKVAEYVFTNLRNTLLDTPIKVLSIQ